MDPVHPIEVYLSMRGSCGKGTAKNPEAKLPRRGIVFNHDVFPAPEPACTCESAEPPDANDSDITWYSYDKGEVLESTSMIYDADGNRIATIPGGLR